MFYQLLLFIFIFGFLILDTIAQNSSSGLEYGCNELHPSCLFIMAVGLAGSTTVMDVVNQHPDIHVRGENNGLFSVIKNTMAEIRWNLDYEYSIKQKKWEDISFFNSMTTQQAYEGVQQMFKQMYGHGENANKIVGFKEIRFCQEEQIEFVRQLCQNTKIIFQYTNKVDKLSHKFWYKNDPKKSREGITSNIALFQEYNRKFPNDTFISTVEDFGNPDYVQNLFDFLELDLDGLEIDVARMYNSDHNKGLAKIDPKQQEKTIAFMAKLRKGAALMDSKQNVSHVKWNFQIS